ncbi:MAG TPA: EAL domain-containing protein, partial [Mariprofundaceae bacterium]|nr:EAL domain-containing protein [Mariprofundaceae bacterium]
LEITESVIMEAADRATEILHEIKSLGVKLAMDDFGSGFSSLGYIKHFPIDTLKIDKVFIRHLPDDLNDAAIVHTILELAYSLGMHVVAEGVENTEQLAFLRNNGCHAVQGYLLGRPVESKELLSMIRDQNVQQKWHDMLKL